MRALPDPDDTIVAVATPPGRGAIGVIRISGPKAGTLIGQFIESATTARDRLARHGFFRSSEQSVDEVVVTFFRGPRSYTGEDMAEISGHGNPATLERMIQHLVAAGARRAAPGEFTLRAVANRKMDLAQAEAVRDFIAAQTEMQARTAMRHMEGVLAKSLRPHREALTGIVADLEAGIDFAEDDVPPPDPEAVHRRVASLERALRGIAETFCHGRLLSEGMSLALAGKPNVGKSSIFNVLAGEGRAIVTSSPGTTRDVITETVSIAGVPVRVADTAGVRTGEGRIEAIGIEKTFEILAEVDLTLLVLDSSRALDEDDAEVRRQVEPHKHLVVINKRDIAPAWDPSQFQGAVYVSARTEEGLDDLRRRLETFVAVGRPAETDSLTITSARQRDALVRASEMLRAGAAGLASRIPHEMVLLDLYSALASIGELTGEVTTDDILERVFSTFCVGK